MTSDSHYYTIEKPSVAEFKERGSKFIAYAFPIADVSEFKLRLAEIKKEHPKATHHCFAYRLGLDGNTYRVSDDGEPSGSAGKPILGQIDSKQVTNVLVIVVRYFGGTQLGIPGDGGEATRIQMNKVANKAVYQGQTPPQNIFNPAAWADFIQAWKRGDFKNKN